MNIGELWVAHPFFPWLMIILAAWVGFSTATQVRNWVRIHRLERHNKSLQEIVENIAKQVEQADSEERCPEEPAAAIEEWETDPPNTIAAETSKERASAQTS